MAELHHAHLPDPQQSARLIRRRLFMLLGQAFGLVVILTVVLLVALLGLLASLVTTGRGGYRPLLASELEAYYAGRGSWQGVEELPGRAQSGRREWQTDWSSVTLLDANGIVILESGRSDSPLAGQPYQAAGGEGHFDLLVDDVPVGALVLNPSDFLQLWRLASGLFIPVAVISFFTGLLTLLIGLLLARRFVSPLADVMSAAQSVAAGDLSARVQVRGPGEVRGLSDSFNRMAATLEAADRQRRDLLADVAHELRTPLTIIRGRLEGVLDGVYPADVGHVAPVLEETYVLERLVEDLRLLTLAESRQLHFDPAPIDLAELAHRAAGLFEAEAADRNIALVLEVEAGVPRVTADPQRTAQVLGNLLSNALRFAPENGRVVISLRQTTQGVELAVSDNGPGVPEDELTRIFERFWRADKSRNRAAGGAGLGLAIARQLMEAQGGTISASNRAGGGLRVAAVFA
jgi:signal transduction histidine kinase